MGAYPACRSHTATLCQTSSRHPLTSKAALSSLSHLVTEGLEATDTLLPPEPRPETQAVGSPGQTYYRRPMFLACSTSGTTAQLRATRAVAVRGTDSSWYSGWSW